MIFYIVAITFLCSHLSHGIASIFQTLGLRSEKTRGTIHMIGLAISVALWIGFLSIPILTVTGALEDKGVPTDGAHHAATTH